MRQASGIGSSAFGSRVVLYLSNALKDVNNGRLKSLKVFYQV